MDFLDSLNREQREAVEQTEGPILLVAGAGTGKTKTLTSRIQFLISRGVHPEKILAITFTNKAAGEMRERVEKILDQYQSHPCIKTFHSLSTMLLRENYETARLPKHFAILDQGESRKIIKEAMEITDYDVKRWDPKKIQSIISKAKGAGKNPNDFATNAKSQIEEVVGIIWKKYEELKSTEKALDFDDLLIRGYGLLEENKNIREYYQNRFEYVHIDEYQDTNGIQYKLAKLLSAPQYNLFAVGDSDQNIYSWRGADLQNILNFEKDFAGARVLLLNQNYRSTQNILRAADEVIIKNKERIPKELRGSKGEGEKISVYTAFSENDEAIWIAKKSGELIRDRVNPEKIAVLFRTNFQSRVLEEAFMHSGIPYQLVGTKFFERAEVKDVLAYLRASLSKESLSDIKRVINVPRRGIGKATIAKIFAGEEDTLHAKMREKYKEFLMLLEKIKAHAETSQISQTVKFIIEKSGLKAMYEAGGTDDHERLENLKELVTFATKYDSMEPEEAIGQMLEDVALLSDQDTLGRNREEVGTGTVKLMTIHAAKGLEFDYVFLTGLEQGLFPSEREDNKNKYEREEERRLAYVAITRAKEKLFLTYALSRTIYGNKEINEPSEFLRDIPEDIIQYEESAWGGNNYGDGDDEEKVVYLDF